MLNRLIPNYYLTKDNIIFYLIFVYFFSLLFVNIFTPFQGAWYNVQHYTRAQLFTDTLLIVTGGTVILLFSRLLMYKAHRKKPLNYLQYISWLILEVFFVAFLYALIVHYAVGDIREFSDIFIRAVIFVPTIIVIPTIITHLYFGTKSKDERISELESKQKQTAAPPQRHEEDGSFVSDITGDDLVLDNHVTGSSNAETHVSLPVEEEKMPNVTEAAPTSNKIINFFDDKDELQLSLRVDNIYFLESAENYVNIYYINKENTERFTLRSTLKKQQEKLEKHGFIRCHRSYLVNFANILLLRKEKDGPYLDFGITNLPQIPVSRTYLDAVTTYFINNSED